MFMLTYHLVAVDDYDPDAADYLPTPFTEEGFIHTTKTPALLAEVANRYYRADRRPYLLLTIDLDRLTVPWRYDAAGEDYPHLYGPLNRDAVMAIAPMPRAEDGTFLGSA
jgi:glutathione S-transferase